MGSMFYDRHAPRACESQWWTGPKAVQNLIMNSGTLFLSVFELFVCQCWSENVIVATLVSESPASGRGRRCGNKRCDH